MSDRTTGDLTISGRPAAKAASRSRGGRGVALILVQRDDRPDDRALAALSAAGARHVPHFHIGDAGAVTQLIDPARAASATSGYAMIGGGRRAVDLVAIAVSVAGADGTAFTPAQQRSLAALMEHLARAHPLDPDAVYSWTPPKRGGKTGALAPIYHRAPPLAPAAPPQSAVLGELAPPPMATLSVGTDTASQQRLWGALAADTFKLRGGIEFQISWAFHLQTAKDNLGAPLAPSSPAGRQVTIGGKIYPYQAFGRDTLFNEGTQWSAVQKLSALTAGGMPADGSLGGMLLAASYADAQAASPQPLAGTTGFKSNQAMPQFALKNGLGPALSGNYSINVAGASCAMQVFAGDTLYTPVAPAGQTTNWGVVKRLADEPAGALREALWSETYKIAKAGYNAASPLHIAAVAARLGVPLNGAYQISFEGTTLQAQVFALDTVYAESGGEVRRMSALAKPQPVADWKAATPGAAPVLHAPAAGGAIDIARLSYTQPPGNQQSPAWPPAPGLRFLQPNEREQLFGKYSYTVKPNRDITITDGWAAANIITVATPQLARFSAPSVTFHKKAAPQFLALLAAWERAGLLDRITTWGGSFFPRMMRKLDLLSAHAFGSAFDINWQLNGQGVLPPLVGQNGSTRELVSLANQLGFYWGGHFSGAYVDGMHFEIATLL